MKKSIIRAVSALMGLGLVVAATSCQNAAAPAKVENVKASELKCEDGTSVTKDNAESILKALMKDNGIPGLFSVKSTSEDVSNVELAKIALNMTRAASEKDPFENIEKAFDQFEKDLAKGNASLKISESIPLKDEDVGLGKADGNATVKANLSVKNNSKVNADPNVSIEDLMNSMGSMKIDYSAKGDVYVKLNAGIEVDKDADSLITAAKANTIAKASVSGAVVADIAKGEMNVKGSAAASDSASFGMAFKTKEGVVGKAIATVTVSAKISADQAEELVKNILKDEDAVEKAINDLLKVTLSVNVYDTNNGVVLNKSFDSAAKLEEWMGAKK